MVTRSILTLILLLATVSSVAAQQPSSPSPEAIKQLQDLADQVKAALERSDLDQANKLSSDLMLGILRERQKLEPTPETKFAQLEQALPATGALRFYALSGVAKAAFDAGEMQKADDYARELLSMAPGYRNDWNYGNAVFFGNMVIGRVALRRDKDVNAAKSSLLLSGQTPGSPTLNSFGPNMSLAKDLLEAGERDVVLEFFDLCRNFWKLRPEKLDLWTAIVKGGGIPDFGANLLY